MLRKKAWQDLANGPVTPGDIDELEALARAHEDLAYRYRSAISLLRKRMQNERIADSDPEAASRGQGSGRPE